MRSKMRVSLETLRKEWPEAHLADIRGALHSFALCISPGVYNVPVRHWDSFLEHLTEAQIAGRYIKNNPFFSIYLACEALEGRNQKDVSLAIQKAVKDAR